MCTLLHQLVCVLLEHPTQPNKYCIVCVMGESQGVCADTNNTDSGRMTLCFLGLPWVLMLHLGVTIKVSERP